jgi:predicted ATPase/class 3 adenylate cyclase
MAAGPESRGALTFVFTDIEGSTRRWETDPTDMGRALAHHDSILQTEISGHGGTIFKHTGDGCVAVFPDAGNAVVAAVAIQRAFMSQSLQIRVAIHSGSAEHRDGDYFGPTLNRAARLLAVGHGGQILVSDTAVSLARGELPVDVLLVDLGEHRLRDIAETERVHQVAVAGLPRDFPPLKSETRSLGGLPTTRTSLIGRSDAIDELQRLCDQHPIVTLTGVGGTGKTRLAIAVAGRMQDRMRDGACFVDLASVADADAVPRAVAEAVGMPQVAGQSIDQDLARFLGQVEAVVVLDNCEHVLDAAADLVDLLVEHAPELRLLVTSREALGVDGEHNWRVPSLAIDSGETTSPAVTLFVDRAEAAGASIDPTDETRAAVSEIVSRLDGIPLAIELAAVRAAHVTPAEILAMLDDRFELLGGGRRRARQRQATLQATVDWSHDLLDAHEQRLLRRLAVFAGMFAAEAVTAVCGEGESPTATLSTLTALVDKSLLVAVPTGVTTRFRMLETIRLYAQEKLALSGEASAVRDRHRDHFLEWSEAFARGDMSPESQDRIESDADNIRAAIDWSFDRDRPDLVVRQVVAVGLCWFGNLRADEAEAWLAEAVDRADADLDAETRVGWRGARMVFAMERSDAGAIRHWIGETIATSPETRSTWRQIVWGMAPDMAAFGAPDNVEANLELVASARAQFEQHPVPWVRSVFDFSETSVLMFGGRFADAIAPCLRTRLDPDADPYFSTMAGGLLAVCHHLLGQHANASAAADDALAEVPERPGRYADLAIPTAASIARAGAGDLDDAHRLLRAQLDAIARRYTHINTAPGIPIINAAVLLVLEGQPSRAVTILAGVARLGMHMRWEGTYALHREYSKRLHAELGEDAFRASVVDSDELTPTDLLTIAHEVAAG